MLKGQNLIKSILFKALSKQFLSTTGIITVIISHEHMAVLIIFSCKHMAVKYDITSN